MNMHFSSTFKPRSSPTLSCTMTPNDVEGALTLLQVQGDKEGCAHRVPISKTARVREVMQLPDTLEAVLVQMQL